MDSFAEKLQRFTAEMHIQAEHLSFTQSCHSVAEAAQAVQGSAEDFVKSICLIAENGDLIVAVVKGEDRVSPKQVGKELCIPAPRLATPQEILAKTGYPCGGTPAFGFPALFLVDERVMERDFVYTGGGSETALIKIAPAEILRVNGARIASIHQ